MTNHRLLAIDLCCGGGGASLGLIWAGFDVIGIDIKPQKNHPGEFIQADIFDLPVNLAKADFIWASPPCQRYSIASKCRGNDYLQHPDLVPPTRELLKAHPYWCMENVPGSPMYPNVILRGPCFGLNEIWRKRYFETSFFCWEPATPKMDRSGVYTTVTTTMCSSNHFYRRKREGKKGKPSKIESKHIMGIPICFPMTREQIGNAVSPYMSYWIAVQAAQQILADRGEVYKPPNQGVYDAITAFSS